MYTLCRHAGRRGTSEACSTCGLVVGIVASLASGKIDERTCAITTKKQGKNRDLYFKIRNSPVTYDGKQFLFMFLQDITYQQRLAVLEKVFFHDITNVVMGIVSTSELMALRSEELSDEISHLVQITRKLSGRLADEIEMQRFMSQTKTHAYRPSVEATSTAELFGEIKDIFSNNPVADGKLLYSHEMCRRSP